jgi:hypothetical protein
MPILTSRFTEIRPAINGSVYHQGILLEATVRMLIDTGAGKTAISHKLFLDNNITPLRLGTTRTPYKKRAKTAIYQNVRIVLRDDAGITFELIFSEIESIIGSTYDFPVILGMDVLDLGKFTLWGRDNKRFTLVLP